MTASRTLAAALANSGRPGKEAAMRAIERALIAAGTDPDVAYTATCLAYDIAEGYDWKVLETARAVQTAMRVKHAEKHPNGQWARLFEHHGLAACYLPDDAPTIRAWASLPGRREAIPADFAEVTP